MVSNLSKLILIYIKRKIPIKALRILVGKNNSQPITHHREFGMETF